MASKRYNLADNAYGILQTGINSSVWTISLSSSVSLPTGNYIWTLVQYGTDGFPSKNEKVYVASTAGSVITVTRWYDGSTPQSFNSGDYIFLNVVSEIIDDVHLRIDEINTANNTRFTELEWNGSNRLKVYRLTGDPALQVRIWAGTYRVGSSEWIYAGWTLTVANNVTTYVMIDGSGTIQTSTSAWNILYARLWIVVSSGWAITSITLWRNDTVGWVLWGLSFWSATWSWTTPNDYNDGSFKAQFKTLTDVGLNLVAEWTYCRLIGFRWYSSSTGGLAYEQAFTDSGIYIRSGSTTTWGAWEKNTKHNIDFFGTGADGDVTISANTTLTRDMHYNNLTVNATYTLNTDGYSVYVKNKLTNNGTIADNGNAASWVTPWAGWHYKTAGAAMWTITQDYLWKWWQWGNAWSMGGQSAQISTYTGWRYTIQTPFEIGRILANRFIWSGWVNGIWSWYTSYFQGAWWASGWYVWIFAMRIVGNGVFQAKWGAWSAASPIHWTYWSWGGGGWSGWLIFLVTNYFGFVWTTDVTGGAFGAWSGNIVATAWESGLYKLIIV